MGTEAELRAVAGPGQQHILVKAIVDATAALRSVEAHMSTYLEDSEISHFNAAQPGLAMPVSGDTMEVLRASREISEQTGRAFDVTCRPVVELWRKAAKEDKLPTDAELAAALALVGWDKIVLREGAVEKLALSRGVDLGGIAKGYGIDRAVAAMKDAGAIGGLVDVGGDVRCFGRRPGGGKWRIGIRNPFTKNRNDLIGLILLSQGAVCTSGNYERYWKIGAKHYSHIVDPRTGRPVADAPSVTVIAPTAMVADAWATALSVLGEKGLKMLPEGVEAMLVMGPPEDYKTLTSSGFDRFLEESR
jgi:thiamine biosynthesis lipoprotein